MFEIYKDKQIFVTGGTGFKGSWLIQWLLKLGAKVKNYSLPLYYWDNVKHFELLNLYGLKNMYHDFDNILNYNWLKNSIEEFKPDIIFHLCAQPIVLKSFVKPKETYETNVIGTINLIESCMNVDSLKGICLITTDKVYDNCEDIYSKRETDKLGANDPYSTSKACTELIAESYRHYFKNYLNQDFIISTVRAGNVIGGGDFGEYRLIPDYIRAVFNQNEFLLRNPHAIRPYIFVLDVLNGYLKVGEQILKNNSILNDSFNFGPNDENEISNDVLVDLLQRNYPYNNVKRNYDSQDTLEKNYLTLDSTKARQLLDWKPKYNIEKAIEQTMNWYKEYIENNNVITEKQIKEYI